MLLEGWVQNFGFVVPVFSRPVSVELLRPIPRLVLLVRHGERDYDDAVPHGHKGYTCGRRAAPHIIVALVVGREDLRNEPTVLVAEPPVTRKGRHEEEVVVAPRLVLQGVAVVRLGEADPVVRQVVVEQVTLHGADT